MKSKIIFIILLLFYQNLYSQSEIPLFNEMDLLINKYEYVVVEITKHNFYVESAFYELLPGGNGIGIVVPSDKIPMYMIILLYTNDVSDFNEYIDNVKIFNLRTRSGINGFAIELKKYTTDLGWSINRIMSK